MTLNTRDGLNKNGFLMRRCWFFIILCTLFVGSAGAQKRKAVDEKVYLDHADELKYDQGLKPGVQIVKGHVIRIPTCHVTAPISTKTKTLFRHLDM